MESFKIRKETLFKWFESGNYIDLCSQPGPPFGKYITSTPLPVEKHEDVLDRLIRDGGVVYETIYDLGLRWERLTVKKEVSHA